MPASVLCLEYPPCTTCKKAKKWLVENDVAFTARHIAEENPSTDELRSWIATSGLPVRRFFNTSGKLYRELDVKARLDAGMTDDEAIELLSSNGMLVKRPIVVGDGFVLVGFKQPEWETALL